VEPSRYEVAEDGFPSRLAGAQAGDEASFAALWRSFNPPLVRFLGGMADPDDAADVASTVWLEVVQGLGRFRGDENGFRAWIFTIARRRTIDLRRAGRRRPQRTLDRDDDADRRVGPAPDPASLIETRSATDDAVALIGSLPPDQAEVLLLRVVADLDVATVAHMLGKRPGNVRVLAHRGLRKLAELLEAERSADGAVTE
jgi:RNA polymerase sigma-70 factor, ECF subfamily